MKSRACLSVQRPALLRLVRLNLSDNLDSDRQPVPLSPRVAMLQVSTGKGVAMQVKRKLLPGENDTRGLLKQYGEQLICVRYR